MNRKGIRMTVLTVLTLLFAAALLFGAAAETADLQFTVNPTADGTDRAAIQEALDHALTADGTITVTLGAGDYYLDNTLCIYSGTKLVCSGATLHRQNVDKLMLMNKSESESEGGYNRSKNITVQGGTWDGNSGAPGVVMIYLRHAQGITISGVTMRNSYGDHFLELVAVKNATVKSCVFRDYIDYGPDTAYTEALQLDYAGQENSGHSEPFDGTPCRDITVSNCTFINCSCGVGNHHPDVTSSNWVFKNNTFTNIRNICVNFAGVDGGSVTGSTASDVGSFLEAIRTAGTVTISGNTVSTASGCEQYIIYVKNAGGDLTISGNTVEGNQADECMRIYESENVTVSKNTIQRCTAGVTMNQCQSSAVTDNTISSISTQGLMLRNFTGDVKGNRITGCGEYNIITRETCSGAIKNNTYDLPYGIKNDGGMTKGKNKLVNAEGKEIPEATGFTVFYHKDDNAEADERTTAVEYGEWTTTLTISELDFRFEGKRFVGWKAYRNDTKTYRVISAGDKIVWVTELPEGGQWDLFEDGVNLRTTVDIGAELHFYAQWEDSETFAVYYHKTDDAKASKIVTTVTYGTVTKTEDYQDLKFFTAGQEFKGWKAYRTDNKTWYVKDKKGNKSWAAKVPSGGSYVLLKNGISVSDEVPAGMELHLYATWKSTKTFTVYYHPDLDTAAVSTTTKAKYGSKTKTIAREELGIYRKNKAFEGWILYRTDNKTYRVKDKSGKVSWARELPAGGSYDLIPNASVVGKVCQAGGELHLYAQWKTTKKFTVYYHKLDDAKANSRTTLIQYGKKTAILKIKTLNFGVKGKKFKGWRVYRPDTKCWWVKDKNGKKSWAASVPEGGSYALYEDGQKLSKEVPAGMDLHLYAQWK